MGTNRGKTLTFRRTDFDCFHITVGITASPDLFSFIQFHFKRFNLELKSEHF